MHGARDSRLNALRASKTSSVRGLLRPGKATQARLELGRLQDFTQIDSAAGTSKPTTSLYSDELCCELSLLLGTSFFQRLWLAVTINSACLDNSFPDHSSFQRQTQKATFFSNEAF
ncbi:hypothetical protein GALMADRAFT_1038997 [Galerina marginata CBS 339.88]|uniref:Uncharacterized protein n=1 Tax=Galerina marginata (strain CBS 339.88) TaxID=685588 RepID=A0A067SCI0_GALM3|nr:hypothetical protein GALMADRAFT_1038997 [Galerina marginata CBS 339.88]